MYAWLLFACKDSPDVLGGQGLHLSPAAEERLLQGVLRIHI